MQSWLWTSERAVSWRLPWVALSLQRQLYDRILPASPRTNKAAQQNRSGARSLRTCWLCTCRCNLARTRVCVGCNSARNLHSSLGSQSGERAAHSILSLAGQRSNSNFPGQSNCMQSPKTKLKQTSSTSYCQSSPLPHLYLRRRQLFHIEQLYLFGTWSFVLQKGPYAVLTC